MGTVIEPRKNGASLKKLTSNQRMFVEYLLADEGFNPTNAARRAGYSSPSVASNRLMKKREIRAVIGKALRERVNGAKIEADAVLKHLATALYLDPLELFEIGSDGSYMVKDLNKIPQRIRRCITKLKCKVGKEGDVSVEVELMSKDAAMTNAMKHLGLVSPDNTNNLIVAPDFLSELLTKVEQERRNIVDVDYIEQQVDQADGDTD